MGDRWRVEGFTEVRELGSGAQGRVVLARHATAGTPVAIKYLTRRDGDEAAVERLRDEAVMLGRVTDPHVVRLYRFVSGTDGCALVMEAVNGVPLRTVLAEHGTLAPEAALTVLKGSLLGLAAAHDAGVVHRDYKPANVVVQADGLSKLIDFGIATFAGEGAGAGTPAYMAPEQWRKRPASPETDVYAATCVFFECVTGHRPYAGGDVAALAAGHLSGPVPAGEVPEALRDLVARGMAKSAEDRPPGAAAFVAELETAARAAYGPDWERQGVRALAGAAVALAAVFPLIAAGLAPAGGAAATAVAAGGTAAGGAVAGGAAAGGTAAGGAAAGGTAAGGAMAGGGGLLAATGAKVAVAVAASAAVAAGGAGVYAVSGPQGGQDGRPTVRAAAITVTRAGHTRTFNRPATEVRLSYPRVSGLGRPAVEAAVNKVLRNAVEEMADDVAGDIASFSGPSDRPTPFRPSDSYETGITGPRLFSVRYQFTDTQRNTGSPFTVNADLTTGRKLETRDLLLPAVITTAGARTLTRLLERYGPGGGSLCEQGGSGFKEKPWETDPTTPRDLSAENLSKGTDLLLGKRGAEFHIPLFDLGYSMACVRSRTPIVVPYERLRDVLRPDVLAAAGAPSGTPSPKRS
ncbi:protein kinase domain-containing protein [Actinomadura xylanilytica]|uniref:protein kinase domain-containing protein n=1 Tax=Actinomadura xylanilytica TaxID=887459 RepID=UPI00255AD30B|nr:protein kinase [Actinomadura xylanilytica]MDL4772079.1 protein kinase [Actinomadura xylanilytica]